MHEWCVEGTCEKKNNIRVFFAVVPPDGKHLPLDPAPGHARPVDDTNLRDGGKWKETQKGLVSH